MSVPYDDYVAVWYAAMMIWGVALLIGCAIGLALWLFRSWSIYQISKRRGLSNPWLSWIPVGQDWMVGSISDQYQYLVRGKVTNRRKVMLWLSIIACALSIAIVAMVVVLMGEMGMALSGYYVDEVFIAGLGIAMFLIGMIDVGIAVALFVFLCMSKYDLYRSAEPKNAVAYLVVSIFFSILDPVFLFICRNKDDGMPPRKPAPQTYVDSGDNTTYL